MFDKRSHQRTSHPNGRYNCRFCDRVYHDLHEYTRHMNAHNNIRPFKCHICDHSSSSKFNLQKHLLRVHQNQLSAGEIERLSTTKRRTAERNVQCRYCSIMLVNQVALKKHLRRKHPEVQDQQQQQQHQNVAIMIGSVVPTQSHEVHESTQFAQI